MAKRPGARGKAPGVRWPDGTWSGFDWLSYQCDERVLDRWAAMQAGVGIKTGPQDDGTWLVGIDADTLVLDHATLISREVYRAYGRVPTRIGRAPKALFVLRLAEPLGYHRIEFGVGENGRPERVEVLSAGRQFVAHGIHPGTGTPYEWVVPLPNFNDLPVLEGSQT